MVVMLPVLLMLFLGLFHFRGIVQTRMRAIEAARYVNWESVWQLRDANGGANKDDEQLRKELVNLGLGRGLVAVRGTAAVRTLWDYQGAVSGKAASVYPVIVDRLFPELETDEGAFGDILGGIEAATEGIEPVLNVIGQAGALVDRAMAHSTGWGDEGDGSVYTAQVVYRYDPEAFYRPFGPTIVDARSSLLSHSYNVGRPALPDFFESVGGGSTDPLSPTAPWFSDEGKLVEYEAVFGGTALGDCSVTEPNGHIFDLWLFPTGNLLELTGDETLAAFGSVLSGIGRGMKCALIEPFAFLEAIDSVFGTSLGFHMPEGTLMEYPENWSDDD